MPWEDVAGKKLALAIGHQLGYVRDRREQLRDDLRAAHEKRAALDVAIADAERALSSLDYKHDQPM